jgi:hypothetical protein
MLMNCRAARLHNKRTERLQSESDAPESTPQLIHEIAGNNAGGGPS